MLKKLKSLFIVEEEQKSIDEKLEATKNVAKTQAPNSKASSSIQKSSTTMSKEGAEKFSNMLLKAVEKANQEGFDYLEFKESVKSLGNVNLDEETKFKSAMAMAETMGATPSLLKSSANYYIDILSQEETKFNNAYRQRLNKTKTDTSNKMKLLDKMMVEKESKLKKLQQEIKKHKAEKLKLSGTIERSDSKANQTKTEFDHAFKSIGSQIKSDLRKIEKYLK